MPSLHQFILLFIPVDVPLHLLTPLASMTTRLRCLSAQVVH